MDIVSRILPRYGVQRFAVHIAHFFGEYRAQAVNGFSRAAEHSSQHFGSERDLQRFSGEYRARVLEGNTVRSLKHLKYSLIALKLDYAPYTLGAVVQTDTRYLVVSNARNALKRHKRTVYVFQTNVL